MGGKKQSWFEIVVGSVNILFLYHIHISFILYFVV